MLTFNEQEKDTIEYLTAIAMIIFGMVLCMFAFWTEPRGQIHPTILGVLGQILIFVGAIFHLNIKLKNANNDFETRVNEMRKELDSLKH